MVDPAALVLGDREEGVQRLDVRQDRGVGAPGVFQGGHPFDGREVLVGDAFPAQDQSPGITEFQRMLRALVVNLPAALLPRPAWQQIGQGPLPVTGSDRQRAGRQQRFEPAPGSCHFGFGWMCHWVKTPLCAYGPLVSVVAPGTAHDMICRSSVTFAPRLPLEQPAISDAARRSRLQRDWLWNSTTTPFLPSLRRPTPQVRPSPTDPRRHPAASSVRSYYRASPPASWSTHA